MRDLATLPKAHLHLHLGGGMRPSTLTELSAGYGLEVPEIRGFGSFSVFAQMYVAACSVVRTPDDLIRLVDETVMDAKMAGAAWVEPSIFAPRHNEHIGADEVVVEIVLDALSESAARHGIGAGLMIAADRTRPPSDALAQAELAVRYSDQGVVAFGLANDEGLFRPEPFAESYDVIRRCGLLSTPHAGELAGPDSVRGALDALGADRVQHGVRAIEDPALVDRLADERICCDVCPSSNLTLTRVLHVVNRHGGRGGRHPHHRLRTVRSRRHP